MHLITRFGRRLAVPSTHQIRCELLAMTKETSSRSDVALDHQIADQQTAISRLPKLGVPSPAAGMARMDKALAENNLIDMKNERIRRNRARRPSQ